MSGATNRLLSCTVLILALPWAVSPAYAGLIGTDIRYQCPECAPPFDQIFTVIAGGPELTPFGQYAIDVEDSSIRVEWSVTASLINPGHHVFSELSPFVVASAVLDPSSTWTPVGLGFTSDSVTLDFSGQSVESGTFALINLTEVPEPASLVLVFGGLAAVLLYAKRRYA